MEQTHVESTAGLLLTSELEDLDSDTGSENQRKRIEALRQISLTGEYRANNEGKNPSDKNSNGDQGSSEVKVG